MLSALTYSQVQSKKEDAVKAAETLYLKEASKKSKKKNKKKNLSKDDKVKDEPSSNKENKNKEDTQSNESGAKGKTKKKKKSNDSLEDGKSEDTISKKAGSQSKLSQLSSAIKGQQRLGVMTADRLINSPGATKHLMGSDSEDASSPVLKTSSKKKKNKNSSDNSSRTRLNSAKDKIVEAGAKLQRALSSSSNVVDDDYDEVDQNEDEGNTDSILTKGIKFSSQNAFMRFVGHNKKAKKRKVADELDGSDNNGFEDTSVKESNDSPEKTQESPTKKAKKDNLESISTESDSSAQSPSKKGKREKKNKTESSPSTDTPISPSSALNGSGIDLAKLRQVLENTDSVKTPEILKSKKSIGDVSKERLAGARFRYLNEQLYTQPAGQSFKQFTKDEELFHTYHTGYQQQAKQWPLDPLNIIIASCLKMPENHVIADMGCGEARLARSVPNKVHSFDLVSTSPGVTACEMSNTPLEAGSVDVVVFCLALMGTNVRDFVFEAGRILKMGGTLKIAELESRFQSTYSLDNFISDVCKFGFKNSWKDVKKGYFYFVDFKKVTEVKKKKKLPEINLKPCLYKKR